MKQIKTRIISALPLIVSLLIIVQYLYVPNFREFTPLDQNAPTNTFVWFLGFFAALFLGWNIVSLFSSRASGMLKKRAPIFTAAFLLLLAYDWATLSTGMLPQPFVPWPDAILNAMIRDREILARSLYHSLRLLFTGYGIGVGLGVISGVAAGRSASIRYWIQPLVKVFGAIPAVTWLPIVIVLSGNIPGGLFGGAVLLIAVAVWYPITSTTMNGVLSVPKGTFEAASTFGVSKLGMIFKVAIPASSPFVFQGLTQGMSIACTALLVAELMGVEAGLGWYINWQRGWADFAGMYAAVVIIAVTFFIVNAVLSMIRNFVLRWKEGIS
ncbi:MAG: ABC transporter permease subunit [Oscillospiraceae bacterium]|nr:ABC transporter permease subunit [Oscillospiraceae bacterium]